MPPDFSVSSSTRRSKRPVQYRCSAQNHAICSSNPRGQARAEVVIEERGPAFISGFCVLDLDLVRYRTPSDSNDMLCATRSLSARDHRKR